MLLARMQSGALGTIEATKVATGSEDEFRLEIHGSSGALRSTAWTRTTWSCTTPRPPSSRWAACGAGTGSTPGSAIRRRPPAFPAPRRPSGWIRSHVACLANFLQAVAEGRPAEPGLGQGIRVQHLMDCAAVGRGGPLGGRVVVGRGTHCLPSRRQDLELSWRGRRGRPKENGRFRVNSLVVRDDLTSGKDAIGREGGGDEKLHFAMAAAAIVLGVGSMVLAQTPQGPVYYSSFYNLSLGRSFVPPPSGFGGGIQTGPTGNFLYLGRTDGAVDIGTPWRRPQIEAVPLLVAPSAVGRLQQLSPLPDWTAAPGAAAGIPAGGMLAPAASLGAIAQRAGAPAGQNLGMPPGIELPGAGGRGTGRAAAGALGPLAPVVGTVDTHRPGERHARGGTRHRRLHEQQPRRGRRGRPHRRRPRLAGKRPQPRAWRGQGGVARKRPLAKAAETARRLPAELDAEIGAVIDDPAAVV